MIEETISQICVWALPILAAIVFHEVAHGWVAYRFGDPTAARMGRLTLNPLSHIDLFGTIILPLLLIVARSPFLFGYAKPVPVNFYNLNHPKRDMICSFGRTFDEYPARSRKRANAEVSPFLGVLSREFLFVLLGGYSYSYSSDGEKQCGH